MTVLPEGSEDRAAGRGRSGREHPGISIRNCNVKRSVSFRFVRHSGIVTVSIEDALGRMYACTRVDTRQKESAVLSTAHLRRGVYRLLFHIGGVPGVCRLYCCELVVE